MKDDNDLLRAGQLNDPNQGTEEVRREDFVKTPTTEAKPVAKTWILKRASEVVADSVETLRRRARKEELPVPLPWANLLPQFGGGLWPGAHLLVGGTGTGKSQWALQVALHAARQGVPVLYLALELGPVDLSARLLGEAAGVLWSKLFRGIENENMLDYAQKKAALDGLPLYLESSNPHTFSYEDLEVMVAQLRQDNPQEKYPVLLVLDFLQLLGGDNPKEELRERIGKASYQARKIALEHKAAVLILSSTGRQNYRALDLIGAAGLALEVPENKDYETQYRMYNPDALVGLGKESGDIEYSADTVTALLRWPGEVKTPTGESSMIVATAKNRAGAAGWGELWFDGGRFKPTGDRSAALYKAMNPPKAIEGAAKKEEKPNGKNNIPPVGGLL